MKYHGNIFKDDLEKTGMDGFIKGRMVGGKSAVNQSTSSNS